MRLFSWKTAKIRIKAPKNNQFEGRKHQKYLQRATEKTIKRGYEKIRLLCGED